MKCVFCKKSFKQIRSSQSACGISCAIEYNKKVKQKKLISSMKTQKQKVQEARIGFQKFIRKRDSSLPCISCGTTESKVWHAGHYLKAELYTGLIFNEINCNKQCIKCNLYLDGNEVNYRLGLVNKYGEEAIILLEKNKDKSRKYRYTDEELEAIKQKYK